jgi:hypothetical protein
MCSVPSGVSGRCGERVASGGEAMAAPALLQ